MSKRSQAFIDTHSPNTARILRLLTSHGIFKEVLLNTFTNTEASATLANNPDFAADIEIVIRNGPVATPSMYDFMKQRYGSSDPSPASAFEVAKGINFYKWIQQPEQQKRSHVFQAAMRGRSQTEGLRFITSGGFLQRSPLMKHSGSLSRFPFMTCRLLVRGLAQRRRHC